MASEGKTADFDVIVVGAGFGGLYALHKLRSNGLKVRVLERGSGIGGTWFWNRYPGARCDNESVEYSYSFSPELQRDWQWSERNAPQAEILAYLEHVAERFDLMPDIQLDTEVTAATWDADAGLWKVETGIESLTARFCVMAAGNLSVAKLPDWPGIHSFEGTILHTAEWPEEPVDFTGRRVAVVGTGSSGIQVIPQIARQAEHLTVFQRTPNFIVPAHNYVHPKGRPVLEEQAYAELRERARTSLLGFFAPLPTRSAMEVTVEEARESFEARWQVGGTPFLLAYYDVLFNPAANAIAADFVRDKIRATVRKPEVAERMVPQGYPIGAKRLCFEIGYYDTFNRDNVALVDLRSEPVSEVTASGVVAGGRLHAVDTLVFATGFEAVTGALARIDIRGRDGRLLREEWADGPRAYLGLMSAGFPNLFLLTGPGSPAALSNVVLSIEQHVEWVADCIAWLDGKDARTIEATPEAQDGWMEHVDAVAQQTLFPTVDSWYQCHARDGRRVFMLYLGGVGPYREKCDAVAAAGYEGFAVDAA
ncbi:MAG: NAD(P)/FAD-dependent oxidoreductase [Sphingomonas sp.]